MGRDKIITLQSLPIQFSLAFRKIFYIIREFLDTNFTPPYVQVAVNQRVTELHLLT